MEEGRKRGWRKDRVVRRKRNTILLDIIISKCGNVVTLPA